MKQIKVGISSCLLGQKVRFNGGHKQARYCTEVLSQWFDFQPICPEVGIGMGIPRKPIRLVREDDGVKVKGVDDPSQDYTLALTDYAKNQANQVSEFSGYVFMQKSPSCGAFKVKTYLPSGMPSTDPDMGAYAKTIHQMFPNLPIEEAGRLNDAALRENFMTRVFAYHDWQNNVAAHPTAQKLVAYHTRYKFLIQAHCEVVYRELGPLVANAGVDDIHTVCEQYIALFMQGLLKLAKVTTHINVMHHLMGFMKKDLDKAAKASILEVIERYRSQQVSLMVPLTLLKHYVDLHHIEYLQNQKYLSPFPQRLGLRNYVN